MAAVAGLDVWLSTSALSWRRRHPTNYWGEGRARTGLGDALLGLRQVLTQGVAETLLLTLWGSGRLSVEEGGRRWTNSYKQGGSLEAFLVLNNYINTFIV